MSVLLDALRSMGLGGQIVTGATLLVVAFYIVKAVSIGKVVGSLLSSAAGYAIVLLAAVGLAIALGWVDPNMATVTDHVSGVIGFLWELVGDVILERLGAIVPGVVA